VSALPRYFAGKCPKSTFTGTVTFESSMEDPEIYLIRAIGEGDAATFQQLERRSQDPVNRVGR
jgi:hypothetical protein